MENNTNLGSLHLPSECKGSEKYLASIKMLDKFLMIETSAKTSAERFIETKGLTAEYESFLGI